ncbi:MAG: hypothetical protein CMI53_05445 [Parcubacteria group bacterium]|jgi:myo-inositol-1(or 4)-monophosphatase|nr:hypothetical protein [Parcubacteria group bacterium]|tara:strand:+ start:5918 stop:6703 length:786 start_codon:yes stop_codon:yes gene_type:complete
MDKDLKKLIEISQSGGAVLKKYFGKKLDVINEKYNASDLQTTVDLESEKVIIDQLKKYFPDYNILSEEVGKIDNGSKFTFVIDPLDGTNNFVLGIANFTSVIGLLEGDKGIMAAVNSPMTNETFYAASGRGAFLNGKKIKVNTESDMTRSTISHEVDYHHDQTRTLNIRHELGANIKVKRLLTDWSPQFMICLLAAGRLEGIIREEGEIHDYVAGKIIAREAGAKITDYQGKPDQSDKTDKFIMSNGTQVHDRLIEVVNKK